MKKIKLILGLLVLLTASSEMFGQQDPHYTQYMYNMSVINPAYAGSKGVTAISLLGRTQWVGVKGAPDSGTFSINSPVGQKSGLGLSVIHDQIGPAKETNLFVDYFYTLFMGKDARLAFGLKGGFSFLDVAFLNDFEDATDELNQAVNQAFPNLGVGAFFYTNKFYLGVSAPNFLNSEHLEEENGITTTASEEMHGFLTAGYVFDLSPNTLLKPSTMVKAAPGSPVSIDLSANVLFNQKVEVGLSYRLEDSVSAMVGFNVNPDFRIGYAYDYTTSDFGDHNTGSHEIILLYQFNKRNIKSPRFF